MFAPPDGSREEAFEPHEMDTAKKDPAPYGCHDPRGGWVPAAVQRRQVPRKIFAVEAEQARAPLAARWENFSERPVNGDGSDRKRAVTRGSRKSDDASQVTPLQGLAMGGLFMATGLAIMCISVGWIPVDPASVHAPMWVLGLCGFVFFLPGALLCYYGIRNGMLPDGVAPPKEKTWGGAGWFVGACIISAFGAIGVWIGFGAGPRQFGGGITGSEAEGRFVFGSMGVLCSILAAWIWYRGAKEIFRPGD